MSAATIFDPLEDVLDQDELQRCRFCGCTERVPCGIPVAEDQDGEFHLARNEAETTMILPCAWFLPGVCNAPACMEKLIAESRGRAADVLLFDAHGRKLA